MADDRVELEVGGRPVSDSNPLPTTPSGGAAGTVEQGAAGVDPWKVDDDATQTAVAALGADGGQATIGAKGDAAWSGSGNGSIVALLKAVYGKVAATLGFSVNAGTVDATTLRVITASDGPLNTNLGTTTDAAVVTDANGSVSSKIRGLVKIFADVWDSTNHGLYTRHKTGSTVTSVATRGTGLAITATAGRLHGFSFRETSGNTAARFYLRDGTDNTGSILAVITLNGGESAPFYFGDRGLAVATGIYLDVAAGSIEGAVYSGAA